MKKLFCISVLVFVGWQTSAQDGIGLRSGVSLDKKLFKNTELKLDAQTRFNNDISYLQTYLFEAGLAYKISKRFDAAVFYRFVNRRKDETKDFKIRHRFYADISYDQKIGKFVKFENRLRYQHQFKDNDGMTEFDASYIRNKVECSFPNKSKFTPQISTDFFFEVGKSLDQLRPEIGVDYKTNKKNSISLSVFRDIDMVGTTNYGPVIKASYKLNL